MIRIKTPEKYEKKIDARIYYLAFTNISMITYSKAKLN